MCNSIKTEFKEKEDLLLISEINIAKNITKNKKNKDTNTMDNIFPDYINKKFIKNILKDLVEE